MIARVVPAVRLPYKAREMYDYLVPENISPAVKRGSVVVIPFAGRRIAGLVIGTFEKSETAKTLKQIFGLADGLVELPPYVVDLWTDLSKEFATTLPRFLWTAMPTVPARALCKSVPAQVSPAGLTEKFVPASFFVNSPEEFLSQLKVLIENNSGRQALVLVPTVEEAVLLSKALGNAVVYHGSLADGAKYNFARAANSGRPATVVSTKSGVFLPFRNLGLVAIVSAGSQSHEQEDSDPRFDARVIAEKLALAAGARVCAFDPLPPLGMTPSGSGGRWNLSNRPLSFPALVHDLHDAAKASKSRVMLCDEVLAAIEKTITQGGRVLALLNRRGVSSSYVCADCGTTVNCPDCKVPLVIHHERTTCFACERSLPLPAACIRCGGLSYKTIGLGSKSLYDAIKRVYPDVSMVHVDRDGATTDDIGRAQIVVGTSAVFGSLPPNMFAFELCIDAHFGAGQARSGVRATETLARLARTLASWTKKDGELHIQTFDPSSPSLKALYEPDGFIAHELEERTAFGYPPAKTMLTLYGAGKDEDKLFKEANVLVAEMRSHMPYATCNEPVWSRPKLFRGKYRLTATIKVPNNSEYSKIIRLLPADFALKVNKL